MARIKRHRNARGHQGIKHRRRKPTIPELIYKFLVSDESARDTESAVSIKCRCCGEKRHDDEVVDFADTPRNISKNMGYSVRKDNGRVSKSHGVKRRPASKNLPISYLQKCVGGTGTTNARKYIKKALDFGIESGYLIPSDPTYKVLRVSSGLMESDSRRRNKIGTCDRAFSKERDTPTKLEDLQVQEQRRRRRRRRRRGRGRRSKSDSRTRRRGRRRRRRRRRGSRSRSRSRSKGRSRYSSPQNPEEVAEDEADDYEMDENDPKSNIRTGDIEKESKTTRSSQPDKEQSTKKAEENSSDLSVDEDESDDEEEKKSDATKS